MSNEIKKQDLSLQATIILTNSPNKFDANEILGLLSLDKTMAEITEIKSEKTQSISVDQIRSIILEASKKNISDKIRVFVLCEADKMKDVAQNSLLKVLEETPPEVLILLLAQKAEDILKTILSRSRVIKLKSKDISELNVLDENFLLDKVLKTKAESKEGAKLKWKDEKLRGNMLELQCLSNKLADSIDEQKLAKLWLFNLWLQE